MRRGFTLVELLVAIGIIAILIALLVPAVQKVRASAARTICGNNMKQLILAAHAFHSVNRRFPQHTGDKTGSWMYQILPFLEHRQLWAEPNSQVVTGTVVPTYFCASLRPPLRFYYTQAGYNDWRAQNDYLGNGGTWGHWSCFDRPCNSIDGPIVSKFMAKREPVNVARITDGTTHTLLVGHKMLDITRVLTQPDCNSDQGFTNGWDNDSIGFANGINGSAGPAVPPASMVRSSTCGLIFGTVHAASMPSLMSDGSVRMIAFTIDSAVWQYVCNRADNSAMDSL